MNSKLEIYEKIFIPDPFLKSGNVHTSDVRIRSLWFPSFIIVYDSLDATFLKKTIPFIPQLGLLYI